MSKAKREFPRATHFVLISVAVSLIALIATAGGAGAQSDAPKFEMGTFYMCVLIKGPSFKPGAPDQQVLQGHFKHVRALFSSGKAALFGPFADDGRIAGVAVLNASSPEEARSIEEQDPLVKSGALSIEVLKWWAAKGVMKSPPNPLKLTKYYLAFLRRGPKWTAERTPETEKIQAAHMANINAMAKTGKLVIAGPFENAGEYAGVFVFKVDSLDEAKLLADGDPAVKAGRLVADVHPWMLGEGSLP